MKRALSESDSDDGEFNDEETQEQSEGKGGEASARKKRRGLIEKKRRDRINTCLAELRRLVPAAVERQGSAKLEKAEILQLTVEHLKAMKNAGVAGQAGVSLMRTTDYHSVGFQRCMAETARFLYNMNIPEVNNPQKTQRTDQINSGTQQSVTGQLMQKPVGLTNAPSALPRPAQDVWFPKNYTFTAPEAFKTDPSKENDGPLKHELSNKDSPYSNVSRQGLQCSFPFKHPAVLPIHAPDAVMSFPLSFLSPAMGEWPFSVAAKSNIKTPPTLFSPWSPQLFGSQTSNIAF